MSRVKSNVRRLLTFLRRLYFCTTHAASATRYFRGGGEGELFDVLWMSERNENEGDETLTVGNERGKDQGLSEKGGFGARASGVTLFFEAIASGQL